MLCYNEYMLYVKGILLKKSLEIKGKLRQNKIIP